MSLNRRPPAGNARRVAAIGQNLRGVMTNKAGRLVQFESFLERSLLLRLDRDATVKDFGSQPETFHFSDEHGKQRAYTPDFIVWRDNESVEIHEVTLASRRARPASCLREAAATTVCQQRGWRFVVHTERELPCGTELANLLALFHYRPVAYADTAVIRAALVSVADGQPVTLDQIISRLTIQRRLSQSSVVSTLYHMLWHGRLETDLHRPLFVHGVPVTSVRLWLAPEVTAQ